MVRFLSIFAFRGYLRPGDLLRPPRRAHCKYPVGIPDSGSYVLLRVLFRGEVIDSDKLAVRSLHGLRISQIPGAPVPAEYDFLGPCFAFVTTDCCTDALWRGAVPIGYDNSSIRQTNRAGRIPVFSSRAGGCAEKLPGPAVVV